MPKMTDEQKFNVNWNIIIVPHADGSIDSRHIGLTIVEAIAVLRAVAADYEVELAAANEEQSDA